MTRTRQLLAGAAVSAALLAACGSSHPPAAGPSGPSGPSGSTTTAAMSTVLLSDSFANDGDKWGTQNTPQFKQYYQNGYRWDFSAGAQPYEAYPDVLNSKASTFGSVTVQATVQTLNHEGGVGVICHSAYPGSSYDEYQLNIGTGSRRAQILKNGPTDKDSSTLAESSVDIPAGPLTIRGDCVQMPQGLAIELSLDNKRILSALDCSSPWPAGTAGVEATPYNGHADSFVWTHFQLGTDDSSVLASQSLRCSTATPTPVTTPAGPSGSQGASGPAPSNPAVPADLVGSWAPFSARIDYDGGGGGVSQSGQYPLQLTSSGQWSYGSSSGTWTTRPITSSDWSRWRVQPYGPTEALVLSNWMGGTATGPIETSNGTPDFVWVIYHVTSPQPALIELRFNR